ncbi:MAG: FtsX-like permease family protein [Cytophagales bacterium]|nr:FtsX-like permease family protein [Cytophagales bacterium]
MNLSYFLAKRISLSQKSGLASAIHGIAVATLAVGLAASIVSFLIMEGFQTTVKNRIYSFSANLLVTKLSLSNSTEEQPIDINIPLYTAPKDFPLVRHVQEFSHKAGLVKTEEDVLGVVFKGVGKRFDTTAFKGNLVEGTFVHFPDSGYSREVVISRHIADKIRAHTGEEITVHFFQNPPRFRRLKIAGIYETNLSDYFDSKFILGDLRLIQRLNDWPDSVAGGLEVYVTDMSKIDAVHEQIAESMDYDLYVEKVSDKFVQVFEWLGLVSRQVKILLGVILSVVCVNMISVILILVMERTQMIGLLKAMGSENRTIRAMFVYQGINLIARGFIWGNAIGLGLCVLQDQFQIITLNPRDYYMSYVPIGWDWPTVIFLNVLIFLVVTVVLWIPTTIITRISPIKAIRFD